MTRGRGCTLRLRPGENIPSSLPMKRVLPTSPLKALAQREQDEAAIGLALSPLKAPRRCGLDLPKAASPG